MAALLCREDFLIDASDEETTVVISVSFLEYDSDPEVCFFLEDENDDVDNSEFTASFPFVLTGSSRRSISLSIRRGRQISPR